MKVREIRLDKADGDQAVRIDASRMDKAVLTPQGFLRVPFYATRTGVFTYLNADGSIRKELRHPEDVFAPESLKTLENIPVTDDHPNARDPNVMLINPDNTREYMIGYTGHDIKPAENEYVSGYATFTDAKAIAAINGGRQELSCGYLCDREVAPGEYNGEKYDVRQRNIIYNHLALVERGRAGANVRLRLDSADAVQVDSINLEVSMEKILVNGVWVEVSKEAAKAIEAEQALNARATADSKAASETERARADRAEAKLDTTTAELTKVQDLLKVTNDSLNDSKINRVAVKKSMKILKVAERELSKEVFDKADEMDDKALMVAVIKAKAPTADLTGKSDDYIEARFDSFAELLQASDVETTKINDKLGNDILNTRNDGQDSDPEAARKRSMEASKNAWKSKAS